MSDTVELSDDRNAFSQEEIIKMMEGGGAIGKLASMCRDWMVSYVSLKMTYGERTKILEAYANASDDLMDALNVFVTQRYTKLESAEGYIAYPVQDALRTASEARAAL